MVLVEAAQNSGISQNGTWNDVDVTFGVDGSEVPIREVPLWFRMHECFAVETVLLLGSGPSLIKTDKKHYTRWQIWNDEMIDIKGLIEDLIDYVKW